VSESDSKGEAFNFSVLSVMKSMPFTLKRKVILICLYVI
jgi:hypothetical protein